MGRSKEEGRVSEDYDQYSPHTDYQRISYNARDFQSRFSASENTDGFGFDSNDEDGFVGELGFGRDDLFLDHRDISNRDRTSDDYEEDYSQSADYVVPSEPSQYDRQDFDFDDIFRANPRPTITF